MFSKCVRLLPVSRRVQYPAVERSRRGCTSSLFISGDMASESFVVLTPHVDLNEKFQDLKGLQLNVSQRGMNMDVLSLKRSWDKLQEIEQYKINLEKKLQGSMTLVRSLRENEKARAEQLAQECKNLKQQLKVATRELWSIEKIAIIGGLSLPNYIHQETPIDDEKVVFKFNTKPEGELRETHVEIAEKQDLIEFYDSSFYFLKGDAAKFELGISFLFLDLFRDEGYVQMSNSDFCRSVTVEGVGLNPTDSNSVFMMQKEENQADPNIRLHLVGGASLVSFCAFHAKSVTLNRNMPLRYVTMSKNYCPDNSMGLNGLFSSWQNSAVEAFVSTSNKEDAMFEFQRLQKKLIEVYQSLGYHFRVEYLPSKSLKPWESLRASVQMFSCSLKQYIEVANISLCDDYISKRLLICCTENQNRPRQFSHIVSSTLVSAPRVLGCVLENDVEKFVMPPPISHKVASGFSC